ncbi:IS1595 family transposase [Alkaliphilus pronyensis]|uniref:IS1595 family transposase n=1 Tax=Alkaliphilus pronyensis TaxID=1482732 RepID=A0A6I0FFS4_9FIRM|nr:IS1595 family transposase [Alkaliphilus pronyensis]KAB3534811.1 IS1595 family transposase [Alkaliphilus pronyensis]
MNKYVSFLQWIENRVIGEPACKGRISHEQINDILNGHISFTSILCTDKHRSYIGFAKKVGLDLKQVKSAAKVNGIYHIQHINSLHSRLKGWMRDFKGVSTKYLINYLYWFIFLESIKKSDMESQINQLFKACSEFDFRETTKTLRKRPHSIA